MIELCRKDDCTGCMACYNACNHDAIAMVRNERGFNEPFINSDKCVECGLCIKSCPLLNKLTRNSIPQCCYAAYSLDDMIRTTSSSGGIFGVLAHEIIKKGGIVFGARFDSKMHLIHAKAETLDELVKLQGSKYTQSYIGDVYTRVRAELRAKREVLFVGTPCQVAGLRAYLCKDYSGLHLVDILCHGVTSPGLFDEYLKKNFPNKDITDFRFRNYEAQSKDCAVLIQGHEHHVYGKHSFYDSMFQKGLVFRESCYRCQFNAIPRQGDITLGDFWGIGRNTPYNPPKKHGGTSFVLVNNQRGEDLFTLVKPHLYSEKRDIAEAVVTNPNIIRASEKPEEYPFFYEDFKQLTADELIKKYDLKVFKAPGITTRIKNQINKLLRLK